MPYSSVLERASGTHKYSVQQELSLLTSTCSVVCLLPQAYSNKLRLAALEVPGFIFLWCLGAQRKGMVINMKKLSAVAIVTTAEGERVSYTYMELDDSGNITSQNNRGSFVALDGEVLAAISTLKNAVNARL